MEPLQQQQQQGAAAEQQQVPRLGSPTGGQQQQQQQQPGARLANGRLGYRPVPTSCNPGATNNNSKNVNNPSTMIDLEGGLGEREAIDLFSFVYFSVIVAIDAYFLRTFL